MKIILILFTSLISLIQFTCNDHSVKHDNTIVLEKSVPAKDSLVKKTIRFPSADGLTITADEYKSNDSLPWILLCHQARFSRGEYLETAEFFASFGYNCLAIDQRSGEEANGIPNETATLAKTKNLSTEFSDAEQDIVAALNYIYAKSGKPVILAGSSYSAGLVLKIATANPKVKAVLAFSPGEYFGPKLELRKSITVLDKPVFITSSLDEAAEVKLIFDAIPSRQKTQFKPQSPGLHGSKALWSASKGNEEYREAVKLFMSRLK